VCRHAHKGGETGARTGCMQCAARSLMAFRIVSGTKLSVAVLPAYGACGDADPRESPKNSKLKQTPVISASLIGQQTMHVNFGET
jgi:hypothetical protein